MFKASQTMLELKSFFSDIPDGAMVEYADIQSKTGVQMDNKGKGYMRSALKSLNREYCCIPGVGIELDSPGNAMQIVSGRARSIDSSLRRANKSSRNMFEKHYQEMDEKDRERLGACVSLFGAVSAVAKGLTKIYKKPKEVKKITKDELQAFKDMWS